MSFLDMFHSAMGWNCSAHVSFRNGLEWLRPCFISQSCWWLDSIYFIFSPVGARREFRALLISPWLGFSELFVFRCGLEFRALFISLWLGVPSSFNFAVAWIFRAICISLWLGVPTSFNFTVAWSLICGTQYSSISLSRFCWSPAEVS